MGVFSHRMTHMTAHQEIGPLSPEKPELVELSEVECCALAHGFAKNAEAVSTLIELVDKEKLKAATDILIKTKHVAFPHNDAIETAYAQIARVELERLDAGKNGLHCQHSPDEHKKALSAVVANLAKPTN